MTEKRIAVLLYYVSTFLVTNMVDAFQPIANHISYGRKSALLMAMDEFFVQKLDSMQRTFSALTERLADPDVANDRYQSQKYR